MWGDFRVLNQHPTIACKGLIAIVGWKTVQLKSNRGRIPEQ